MIPCMLLHMQTEDDCAAVLSMGVGLSTGAVDTCGHSLPHHHHHQHTRPTQRGPTHQCRPPSRHYTRHGVTCTTMPPSAWAARWALQLAVPVGHAKPRSRCPEQPSRTGVMVALDDVSVALCFSQGLPAAHLHTTHAPRSGLAIIASAI